MSDSDEPKSTTKPVLLGRHNYDAWLRQLRARAVEKDAWAIVKGSETKPAATDAAAHASWRKRNNIGLGIILKTIDADNTVPVEDETDAAAAFAKL